MTSYQPSQNNNPDTCLFLSREPTNPLLGRTAGDSVEADEAPYKNASRAFYGTSFPPELYEKLHVFVQAKGWNILMEGVTIRQGQGILDLGYGDGGNTAQLAKDLRDNGMDCVVLGVEEDPKMVERAAKLYPKSEHPNLILIEGAAENVDTFVRPWLIDPTNKAHSNLSLVVSNYTLHWVRNPENPIEFRHGEMFRSLNALQPIGGVQRHFCAHSDAFKELFEAGYKTIRESDKWKPYFRVAQGDFPCNGVTFPSPP